MRFLSRLVCALLLARFAVGLLDWRAPMAWLDFLLGWMTPPATAALRALADILPPAWAHWLPAPRASHMLDAALTTLTGTSGSPWAYFLPGRVAWVYLLTLAAWMILSALLQALLSAMAACRREMSHQRTLGLMKRGHEQQMQALESQKRRIGQPAGDSERSPDAPLLADLKQEWRQTLDRLNRDDATRLYNRAYYFYAFAHELAHAAHTRQTLSVVLFRLGGGRHGEVESSQAERLMAQAARAFHPLMAQRRGVTGCRYEPSALVILLPSVGAQEAITFAERVQAHWAGTEEVEGVSPLEIPVESAAGVLTVVFPARASVRHAEKPPPLNEERLSQQLETLAYEALLQGTGRVKAHAITVQ